MQNCLSEVLLLLTPSGLLTTLVYLYLNPGKPTKKVNHPTETFPKDEKPDAGWGDHPAAQLQG